jgi:hypothetical protein
MVVMVSKQKVMSSSHEIGVRPAAMVLLCSSTRQLDHSNLLSTVSSSEHDNLLFIHRQQKIFIQQRLNKVFSYNR